MAKQKIRIVHVINSFVIGGAEMMLRNLLLRTDRERFELSVATLIDDLPAAGPVIDAGISVTPMGMKPGIPDPRGLLRLAAYLRRVQPDVVQTWLDHSNFIGGLATKMGTRAKLIWGIHHSDHMPQLTKRMTLATVAACGWLSRRFVDRIVFCSEQGRNLYCQRGFSPERVMVIPNGFDSRRFSPDPQAYADVRRELGLTATTPLIGLVARYHPLKDHATFVAAAGLLANNHPGVHFLLCGTNVDAANEELTAQINRLGIADRCHLLGPRRDIPRIQAALDVATSSSVSEAFPLAMGEAMACGVPCVATDVGDSNLIVGPAGKMVAPRDPQAMADAWAHLLALSPEARRDIASLARRRIVERFDLDAITRRYEALYDELLSQHGPSTPHETVGAAIESAAPAQA